MSGNEYHISQRLITIPFIPQEVEFICLKIQLFIYNTGEFASCLHVNILLFTVKKRIKVIEIRQRLRKLKLFFLR